MLNIILSKLDKYFFIDKIPESLQGQLKWFDHNTNNYYATIYVKAKRIVNILKRFVYNYKLKKAINYDFDQDLDLDSLSIFKKKHLINIYQNNTNYIFRLTDLINIICENLYHSEGLFPNPKQPKNPFINIEFKTHHLYAIYFRLLDTHFNIPIVLNMYFNCEFSIKNFLFINYPFVKERTIENYMNNCNIFYEITRMLNELKKLTGYEIKITSQGTQEIIIRDFKPCLHKWLRSLYSSNSNIKHFSNHTIIGDIKKQIEGGNYNCITKYVLPVVQQEIVLRIESEPLSEPHDLSIPLLALDPSQESLSEPALVPETDIFSTIDRIPRSPSIMRQSVVQNTRIQNTRIQNTRIQNTRINQYGNLFLRF